MLKQAVVFFSATFCYVVICTSCISKKPQSSAPTSVVSEEPALSYVNSINDLIIIQFSKFLFRDTSLLNISTAGEELIEKQLNRLALAIYSEGNQAWQLVKFKNRRLIPKTIVKLTYEKNAHARVNCSGKKRIEISVVLIRRLIKNSIERAIEVENKNQTNLRKIPTITGFTQFLNVLYRKNFLNGSQTVIPSDTLRNFLGISLVAAHEFAQGLTFITGHEYYHVLSGCEISRESELYADIFGAIMFNRTQSGFALRREFMARQIGSNESLIEAIGSRNIEKIIKSTYENTPFENGDALHMTLKDRLSLLSINLQENNYEQLANKLGKKIVSYYWARN